MTQVFLAGTLAALCGLLFGAEAVLPPVSLLIDFEHKPSTIALEAMKMEVASLMKSSGLSFDWKFRPAKRDINTPKGIAFRFKGKCYGEAFSGGELSELAPYGETVALASTPVVAGSVQPFSEVQCDQIRKCISADAGSGKHQRELALGRAMGRVVAHELYHILLDTRNHAAKGVSKSVHSGEDLVSGEAEFDSYDREMLRSPRGRSGASAFRP